MKDRNNNKMTFKTFRMMLTLVLAFSLVIGTGVSSSAYGLLMVNTDGQASGEEMLSVDTVEQEPEQDAESFEASAGADAGIDDSEAMDEEAPEAGDDTADEETAADPVMDNCDFAVEGAAGTYSFDDETGVLTITGDAKVSMKEGVTSTPQRIVVADSCTVTLDGVNIKAADKSGPGILIQATNTVHLNLKEGTSNIVEGAHGSDINATSGGYAGIEVEFLYEDGAAPSNQMASLIIEGSGELKATGGPNAAGIGGSNSMNGSKGKGLYGNITINSGTVDAKSPGNGAGIGSSDNPGTGTSTGSYKKTGNNTWGTITINGGTVNAVSTNSGAGIGGGNHVDSGRIVINGGTVTANGAAGIGCGIGSSKNKGYESNDKGPGYYAADVTITGGNITASSNDIGAAIGGGMYCDAVISISGGTINAVGGSREGKTHHGGAGIGGGYLGHAVIEITGGNITAVGGDGAAGIGSGGSPNSNEERGTNGRGTTEITTVDYTVVNISGGTIKATGGEKGGAGIGLGVGADKGEINITGGNVTAIGAASQRFDEDVTRMAGGAGIGSAYSGIGSGSSKYFVVADVDISITDGTVVAIGGWGASGIGSGAQNKTANNITIDANKTDLQAYSDGTKFAIDTRDLKPDGSTESLTEGRVINGNILQGTFVHEYVSEDGVDQGTEGIKAIQVINDSDDGDKVVLTGMADYDLEGYRSFAANVSSAGYYNVFTRVNEVAQGEGRYYNKCTDDTRTPEDVDTDQDVVERGVKYIVTGNSLSDNFYLFPVKAVIVSKTVNIDGSKEGLTGDVYFSLRRYTLDGEGNKTIADDFEKRDGKQWIESIHIEDGVAKNKAKFICVDEAYYDVWEVTETGEPIDVTSMDVRLGDAKLVKIETKHGEGSDNNAHIDKDNWVDNVEVINYYERNGVEILIKKSIGQYFDASKTSNATFVFRVEALGDDASAAPLYEDYISTTFTEAGGRSEELTIKGVTGIRTIRVTEVYGAGYEPADGETVKTIDVTSEGAKNEDGQYEFSFENKYDTTEIVEGSGVRNIYKDGEYDSSVPEKKQQ